MAKVYVKLGDGRVVFQSPRPGTDRVEFDNPSGTGSVLGATVSEGQLVLPAATSIREDQAARLSVAYRRWTHGVRNSNWPDVAASKADGTAALLATNKWIYMQVALGRILVVGLFETSSSNQEPGVDYTSNNILADDDVTELSIQQIEWACTVLAPLWYDVMLGNATLRGQWAAAPVGNFSPIYSDIINQGGAPVDRSTIAGQFTLLSPIKRIVSNFDPEDLRLGIDARLLAGN